MADTQPNEHKYILTGGQLNVDEKQKVKIPPEKAKNCKGATIALNSGNFMTIKADDNIVIKDDKGIVERKDLKGNTLSSREGTKHVSRKTTRKSSDVSIDRM